MLGVIHRTVLGLGPSVFSRFFRPCSSPPPPLLSRPRHFRHLVEPCFTSPDFLLHSAIGMVRIYNLLPDFIVAAECVSDFQSLLSSLLKDYASHRPDWPSLFSPRVPLAHHPLKLCRDWRG